MSTPAATTSGVRGSGTRSSWHVASRPGTRPAVSSSNTPTPIVEASCQQLSPSSTSGASRPTHSRPAARHHPLPTASSFSPSSTSRSSSCKQQIVTPRAHSRPAEAHQQQSWLQTGLTAARTAAQQAVQLASARIHSATGPPLHPEPAMDHMLHMAQTCGLAPPTSASTCTPSSQHLLGTDAVGLFVASIAPLLAADLLSPADAGHLMGQGAADQAADFCFLLKAVAKSGGQACDLSSWCLEAGNPQAVLVYALWLLSTTTGAGAGGGSGTHRPLSSTDAQALASRLLRSLGVSLQPHKAQDLAESPAAASTGAECSVQEAAELDGSSAVWAAPSSGGGWGSRWLPRVLCSSIQVNTEGAVAEELVRELEEQEREGGAPGLQAEVRTAAATAVAAAAGILQLNGSREHEAASARVQVNGKGHGVGGAVHSRGAGEGGGVVPRRDLQRERERQEEQAAEQEADSMTSQPLMGPAPGPEQSAEAGPGAEGAQTGERPRAQAVWRGARSPGGEGMRLMRPLHQSQEDDEDSGSESGLGPGPGPSLEAAVAAAAADLRFHDPESVLQPGLERQPAVPLRLTTDFAFSGVVSDRLTLPLVGPMVISNCKHTYPFTDLLVPLRHRHPGWAAGSSELRWWEAEWAGAKLALRFEYVADRKTPGTAPVLHVFNVSRVRRGFKPYSLAFVNGRALAPGGRGVALAPGDVVALGVHPDRSPALDLKALRLTVQELGTAAGDKAGEVRPPSAVDLALKWYCRGLPEVQPGAKGAAAAIGRMKAEVARDPKNTSAWLAWAQLLCREGRSARTARDVFRAALQSVDDLAAAQLGAEAEAAARRLGEQRPEPSRRRLETTPRGVQPRPPPPPPQGEGQLSPPQHHQAEPSPAPSGTAPAGVGPHGRDWDLQRRRIQVLFHWARMEWGQGCTGSARHLWRRAADLTYRHPDGAGAGGHWRVMQAWAQAELDSDHVGNARIILAEALRRSPAAQPLYVLGGSVELVAGDLELAKGFCMRAYEMARRDEALYAVWPRVEAAMGEADRARVLFERGMEYHPESVGLLEQYAEFEAQQGDAEHARELLQRALTLQPEGPAAMRCRVAYASLMLEEGQLQQAREAAEEAEALDPEFAPLLLMMARLERLSGNLEAARQLLLRVATPKGTFRMDVMKERALLHRANGERDLARALDAHLRSSLKLLEMKRAGHTGGEAWAAFFQEAGSEERQQLVRRARNRKIELGLWEEVRQEGVGEEGKGRVVVSGRPVRGPAVPEPWQQRELQLKEQIQRQRLRAEAEARARQQAEEEAAAAARAAAELELQQQLELAAAAAAAEAEAQELQRQEAEGKRRRRAKAKSKAASAAAAAAAAEEADAPATSPPAQEAEAEKAVQLHEQQV